MRKGELDIDLMPAKDAKRILKDIVHDYLEAYGDSQREAVAVTAVLVSEGLVYDNYREE